VFSLQTLQVSIRTLEQKVKKFENERFAGRPDIVNFSTGITSYEMFKAAFKVS